jgi:hypothetical protein
MEKVVKVNPAIDYLAGLFTVIEQYNLRVVSVHLCKEDIAYIGKTYAGQISGTIWGARIVAKYGSRLVRVYGPGNKLWISGPRLVDFNRLVKG